MGMAMGLSLGRSAQTAICHLKSICISLFPCLLGYEGPHCTSTTGTDEDDQRGLIGRVRGKTPKGVPAIFALCMI